MTAPKGDPCILVVFGASGDMMRRLLMPSLYNLACDGLLSQRIAIIGVAREDQSAETFRGRMSTEVRRFTTREHFDDAIWADIRSRLEYASGSFEDDATYSRVAALLESLATRHKTDGNALFYLATPPAVFGMVAQKLAAAGLN